MSEVPAITRVVETGVYVEDLDRSVSFYKDLFEFETEVRDDLICVLRVPGGQALILFPKRIASEPGRTSATDVPFKGTIPSHGGDGRQHIALAIPAAELPSWERRLTDRDIEVIGRTEWPRGGKSIYIRDPDDHLIEFLTPGLWSFY